MTNYHLLWPMTDEPALPDDQWLSSFLTAHSFPCKHIDYRVHADPIVIKEYGQDTALNLVARVCGDYIRSDLIELLSPEIGSNIQFGRLTHAIDGPIENVRTYWGTETVWLRGGKRSYCTICPTCGQMIYGPMGSWYLLASNIPPSPVFTTHHGGIVVMDAILDRIIGKRKKWKKISISKLPVLEKPKDGFPDDLRTITPELERDAPWETNSV